MAEPIMEPMPEPRRTQGTDGWILLGLLSAAVAVLGLASILGRGPAPGRAAPAPTMTATVVAPPMSLAVMTAHIDALIDASNRGVPQVWHQLYAPGSGIDAYAWGVSGIQLERGVPGSTFPAGAHMAQVGPVRRVDDRTAIAVVRVGAHRCLMIFAFDDEGRIAAHVVVVGGAP